MDSQWQHTLTKRSKDILFFIQIFLNTTLYTMWYSFTHSISSPEVDFGTLYSSAACLILIPSQTALPDELPYPFRRKSIPCNLSRDADHSHAVHFPVQRSGCTYFRRFAVTMEYQFEASVDTKQATLNRLYRD